MDSTKAHDLTAEPRATSVEPTPADAFTRSQRKRPFVTIIAPLVPIAAIAAVWHFADLGKLDSPERVAEAAQELRESPAGIAYVLLAFIAGTLLFLPVTALQVGTLLAFGPLHGFAFAYFGALIGAGVTYWVGRVSGGHTLDYVGGKRVDKFKRLLTTHAFRASIAARLLPVGNFTIINLLCGSMRIPFRSFCAGNAIGILPGLVILTLFADQISAVLRSPDKKNLTILAVAGLVVAALSIGLKVWYQRRERAEEQRGEATS